MEEAWLLVSLAEVLEVDEAPLLAVRGEAVKVEVVGSGMGAVRV